MIRHAIAAALLAGLASPVLAGQFSSLDQAAGIAAGKISANGGYDGTLTRTAVPVPFPRAATSGEAAAETSIFSLQNLSRPSALAFSIPAPRREAYGNSPRSSWPAAANAALGAGLGLCAGFGIGFVLSKTLS